VFASRNEKEGLVFSCLLIRPLKSPPSLSVNMIQKYIKPLLPSKHYHPKSNYILYSLKFHCIWTRFCVYTSLLFFWYRFRMTSQILVPMKRKRRHFKSTFLQRVGIFMKGALRVLFVHSHSYPPRNQHQDEAGFSCNSTLTTMKRPGIFDTHFTAMRPDFPQCC